MPVAFRVVVRETASFRRRPICARMACRRAHEWREDFSDLYARAREERADLLAKEILEIADAPCKDAVEVAHARNRLDTRKWLASKLAPRKYGDRVEHDHKGGLNFQPAVLVQIGKVGEQMKTISGDPHNTLPGTLPDEE